MSEFTFEVWSELKGSFEKLYGFVVVYNTYCKIKFCIIVFEEIISCLTTLFGRKLILDNHTTFVCDATKKLRHDDHIHIKLIQFLIGLDESYSIEGTSSTS